MEAENLTSFSERRKQELINEALNEARKRGDTLMRNIKKDVEKEAKNNAIKQDILNKGFNWNKNSRNLITGLDSSMIAMQIWKKKKRHRKAELEKNNYTKKS